jgi:hypothetical protein
MIEYLYSARWTGLLAFCNLISYITMLSTLYYNRIHVHCTISQ